MPSTASVTPAMRQYLDAKRQHRDAIVFFRMGDFYEMFYEDALVAARALDLTLTSRSKDAGGGSIPMCGVPFHAVDGYLAKLVTKGFRVAICEQVEDPKKARGIVRREVVRVVSPGTLTDATYLSAREPAYLMAIVDATSVFGVALMDLSTGEFTTAEYSGADGAQALADEIAVLRPREIVLPEEAADGSAGRTAAPFAEIARLQLPVTKVEPWNFAPDAARRTLLEQLKAHGLEGFGLERHAAAVQAAGGLVAYLRDSQKADLAHVRTIQHKGATDSLVIDPITLRHLEVVTGSDGDAQGSLLHEIDRTVTAMGGRLLRAWLLRPLCALEPIRNRLDAVEELAFRVTDRGKFRETLKTVYDLERLVARVALGAAGPRDLVALRQSLAAVPRVRAVLADLQAPLLRSLVAELDDLADVRDLIERTLVEEPPAAARDGGFTRDGIDAGLDELKAISRSGRQVIAAMENGERTRTGIASLKVRFNRVFGYYIEVSKANLHAVPSDYQRKQTIAGGERFTTPALKEYEAKVLGADERILERELEIFERLRGQVAAEAPRIQDTARALAALDGLTGLAETASVCNFTKPHVHEGDEFVAADARHPVVERFAPGAFVPNDIDLNGTTRQLVILTGPNMGGKSTYLRQVALIPVLAQIGSFVPARDAKVPIVDRIFARVGASDNIARGQSTFMVEMQETANILHSATSRSLVVLDEIGRGTSTFDGLSIAWAVAEHLVTNPRARPKTLFATHYHELTDLADALPGVANAHVAAREWKDDIVFLRKIVPGRSDRSYGIQVARLAGLPSGVVARARDILAGLERDELSRGGRPTLSGAPGDPETRQLALFGVAGDLARDNEALRRLKALDIDETTPRQALELLAELKKIADED
ncbi:MAG: DNA mismatch repair protein MutS [Acidobacteria bacterium RIFCSPLOWO2_02_FULL_68_18]|nr:MAG: DNA mismatch repair protein MutS [Acidobacteria bacterium RIFCSPLOWO2_02_FULL_68_18]